MLNCLPQSTRPLASPASLTQSRTVNGVLVLDKSPERTSFSVVKEVQKLLKLPKVGHCGTLDPFATGVLVLCLNRATRIADQLLEQDKVYRFTVRFGFESDTLDRTGTVVPVYAGPPLPEAALQAGMDRFRGVYEQQVPRFAAVRIQGRRLYEWSRKGIAVAQPRRHVTIHGLRLLAYDWPEAVLEVHCSKGTYVRQLAADIGQELRCGAYVRELRRLESGPFTIARAITLEELRETSAGDQWQHRVLGMNEALAHLPLMPIADPCEVQRLQDGQVPPALEMVLQQRFAGVNTPVRLATDVNHDLIALWWPRENAQQQRRLRVFGADTRENTLSS